MENERDNPRLPGALGLGQSTATSLNYFFTFFCYVTPVCCKMECSRAMNCSTNEGRLQIFGAIVADSWLGRYNAIMLFSIVYVVGLLILFVTSLPGPLENGAGLGGLITTMIILGIGTGGIKSNVSPLIAEQYTETRPRTKTLKSGERVVIDPAVTIQSLYNIFYWCINIGSLSAIATVWMELKIDFWAVSSLSLSPTPACWITTY